MLQVRINSPPAFQPSIKAVLQRAYIGTIDRAFVRIVDGAFIGIIDRTFIGIIDRTFIEELQKVLDTSKRNTRIYGTDISAFIAQQDACAVQGWGGGGVLLR
jgi:hypothetical protein